MPATASPHDEGYTSSSQRMPRFAPANQGATPRDRGQIASVIPLNRSADSAADIGYDTPPPPVSVPFGWRLTKRPDGWLLTHDDETWPIIERCIRERRGGASYTAIARRLAAEGAPAPTGRAHGVWHMDLPRRYVAHYAPQVAAYRGPRGAGLPGPIPGSPEAIDDFERTLRRAAELGAELGDEDEQ